MVAVSRRFRQQVRQRAHQITRRLPIKTQVGGIAVDVTYLIIKHVRSRDTRNQLLRITIAQVGILQAVEKFGIDISHLDQRQIDRSQSKVRVATIAPRVAPRGTRQHSLIVGAILRIDRQLDLCARIRYRRRATDIERHNKSRERQRCRSTNLEGTFALCLGTLHKLITERERYIEQLHTAENIVVLVTDRTAQTIETRRSRALQLDLVTLWQSGRAEDIAIQVSLLGRKRVVAPFGPRTDKRHLGRGCVLLELYVGTAEVAHTHNLIVCILDTLRTEQVVGEEINRLSQHLRAHLQFLVIDNVQTTIINRIEAINVATIATCDGRVIVRKEIDVTQSIYRIVAHNRLTSIVIPHQILAHLNRNIGTIATHRSIDLVENVVDREIEVSVIAQGVAYTRSLLVQHREVQHITLVQQRRGSILQNDRSERSIAETILDLPDSIGTPLLCAIGYDGTTTRRGIDLIRRLGVEVSARVHIDLDIRCRALGLQRVEIDRGLANTTFQVVPPILLVGVGREVGPEIKIRTQESFVGLLAHVAVDLICGDTLLARHALVSFDLVFLEQIFALRDTARNTTPHCQSGYNEYQYRPTPKFHIALIY